MSLNDLKAEFSQAYVRAVAHAAGYFVNEPGRMMDGDGVELTVFSRGPGNVAPIGFTAEGNCGTH